MRTDYNKGDVHINMDWEMEYVELCPTLDIIGDYSMKALQGYQFRRFCNIIIGIHEDEIPSYNAPVRAFIKEQKIKL